MRQEDGRQTTLSYYWQHCPKIRLRDRGSNMSGQFIASAVKNAGRLAGDPT